MIFRLVTLLWLLFLYSCYNLGQLRDFINKFQIRAPRLVKDSKVLMYITNGMALFAINVGIQYEIVEVPNYVILQVV